MERSEPSLVPEWLKGAGGGGGATHHSQPPTHQDEGGGSFPSRQRSQAAAGVNHGDYDSPRYSAASDRSFYSSSRRGGNNTSGASERPLFERDSYSRAYSSFGQRSGYRGVYDGLDRDRDGSRDREREWDWERERDREFRDRERDRTVGFGGGDDRDRDRPDGSFRRPTGVPGRYDGDVPLRRTQSMGSGRALENGDKKPPVDLGTLPTAPPTNSGTLTSSMQKAAFERNFPSLGAHEKQGAVQSSLGNISVLSPRPSWQSSSPRTDGTRSSSSTPGLTSVGVAGAVPSVNVGGTGIGGEGWSSALAEVPASLSATSSINGVAAGGASVPSIAGGGSGLTTGGAPALIVPKMAEALSQNPPRVRTPPQYPIETQRLEDAVVKQSRQLIPMKPSLPKNMGQREKIKPKVVRAVDVIAPQPIKQIPSLTSSQLLSTPFRPPASPRPEPMKAPQGKLMVRRPSSKEAVAPVLSPVTFLKIEGGASSSLVNPGSAIAGLSGVTTNSNPPVISAPVPRKQKQLLDRRAVPIPPTSIVAGFDGVSGQRFKEGGSASEDKRPTVPAQNRSDFFNALRKKAAGAGAGSGNTEKPDSASQLKNDGVNGKGIELEEDVSPYSGQGIENPVYKPKENGVVGNSTSKSTISDFEIYGIPEEKERSPTNGAIGEVVEGNSEQSTAPSSPVAPVKRATATEEEEAAFLRSLGWEESAEESGEGLTEEEINSFFQERLRNISVSPSLPVARNHRLTEFQGEMHVGSIGSISSGISSSDSDSDDDVHVRRR